MQSEGFGHDRPKPRHSANGVSLLVRLHGDAAAERARLIAERMHNKGDHEGADTWLRIIVAIGDLRGAAD